MSGPRAATDVIVELDDDRIVLVRRLHPPAGWALPGGFVETAESAEAAAVREMREELGTDVELTELFHTYSDPDRDPRRHTLSVVFLGRARGPLRAGDDAADARPFALDALPPDLAFDHRRILSDFVRYRRDGTRPAPRAGRLSAEERIALLACARAAIVAVLEGRSEPDPPRDGTLAEPGSAFVTLRRQGELRGCIGTFARDRALAQTVRDMAVAAAFEDPRFAPLTREELDGLVLDVSVLSMQRRAEAGEVTPGLHGLSVRRGERKAVFLPQVATEAGWDRETLLAETCAKAGLDPDAWKDPETEIHVFTAEVFGEDGVRG